MLNDSKASWVAGKVKCSETQKRAPLPSYGAHSLKHMGELTFDM